MTDEIDFDALSRKVIVSGSAMDDMNNLYRAVFALSQCRFIARGQFPDVRPYIASNAQVAGGQSGRSPTQIASSALHKRTT